MHDIHKIDKQKLERVQDKLKKDTQRQKVVHLFLNTPKKKKLGSGGKMRVSQV